MPRVQVCRCKIFQVANAFLYASICQGRCFSQVKIVLILSFNELSASAAFSVLNELSGRESIAVESIVCKIIPCISLPRRTPHCCGFQEKDHRFQTSLANTCTFALNNGHDASSGCVRAGKNTLSPAVACTGYNIFLIWRSGTNDHQTEARYWIQL